MIGQLHFKHLLLRMCDFQHLKMEDAFFSMFFELISVMLLGEGSHGDESAELALHGKLKPSQNKAPPT